MANVYDYPFKPSPAPQIIDGESWEIRDSGDPRMAYIDFTANSMVVPLGDSPDESLVRAHETAHVKISPRKFDMPEGVAVRTIQAVEDARVYSSLKAAGIDTDVSVWSDKEYFLYQVCPSNLERARALVATRGTADRAILESLSEPELVELVDSVIEPTFREAESRGTFPTFEETLKLSRTLQERIIEAESGGGSGGGEETGEGEETPSLTPGAEPSGVTIAFDKRGENDYDYDRGVDRKDPTKEAAEPLRFAGAPPIPRKGEHSLTGEETRELTAMGIVPYAGDSSPGDMLTKTPRLAEKLRGRPGRGIRRLSSDSGTLPRRLNRMLVDGQVFVRKVRKGKATILVDCSGSMALTAKDILGMIQEVPDAKVAVYTGHGVDGTFAVVAENRKCISKEELDKVLAGGGSNVVDYPALVWLSKQPEPRFWICDGHVTGKYDGVLTSSWVVKLSRLVRNNRIKRVGSLKALYHDERFQAEIDAVVYASGERKG